MIELAVASSSSSAAGKNSIDLLLCGLDSHWRVIIFVRNNIIIIVNTKLISMHIIQILRLGVIVVIILLVPVPVVKCRESIWYIITITGLNVYLPFLPAQGRCYKN